MTRFPCRCRRCGARRTLAQLPHLMRNLCKCAVCLKLRQQNREAPLHCDCGGTYRVDWYRRSKEHKRTNCTCGGYPWSITNGPHRRGSLECYYHAHPSTGCRAVL